MLTPLRMMRIALAPRDEERVPDAIAEVAGEVSALVVGLSGRGVIPVVAVIAGPRGDLDLAYRTIRKRPLVVVEDPKGRARERPPNAEHLQCTGCIRRDWLRAVLALQHVAIDRVDHDRLAMTRGEDAVGHLRHAVDDREARAIETDGLEPIGEHLVALEEARLGSVAADADRGEVQPFHLFGTDPVRHEVEREVRVVVDGRAVLRDGLEGDDRLRDPVHG